MRKAEVRTSRLATTVVWPNMSKIPNGILCVCGLDLSSPFRFSLKK